MPVSQGTAIPPAHVLLLQWFPRSVRITTSSHLTVDFIEKMCAVGRVLVATSSVVTIRKTTLTLRIDRLVLPSPEGFRNEVQIVATSLALPIR